MTARVIQGFFIGGGPRMPSPVAQPKALHPALPRLPGPPVPAFAGRPPVAQSKSVPRLPGPPAPAFAARPPVVQPRAAGDSFPVDPGQLGLANGGGRPLPEAVRGRMEAALGADFSNVRVHVGPQAERIGAIAFTLGSDIYFAPGRYQPESAHGRQLLGHELAHVVQQRQGRVRNPMGSGIAVVQDRALEAEADRLGQRAAAHRVAVQLQPASIQARQTAAASVGAGGATFGSRSASIQRTIWRYDTNQWVVDEVGTRGRFAKPKKRLKDGEYFNDINGKRNLDKERVRAGLSDLMMIAGSQTALTGFKGWPAGLWDTLMELDDGTESVVTLGTVKLASGTRRELLPQGTKRSTMRRVWDELLEPFMRANGQLPYIERQDWYKNGEFGIDVDINFYMNRGARSALDFHKDTGGDNLFVNLLFNNQTRMPATEWIEDLTNPPAKKAEEMVRLMPGGMRTELQAARARMLLGKNVKGQGDKIRGAGKIRGGRAPAAAFVSWVDDLVWHATPHIGRRTEVPPQRASMLQHPEEYWLGHKLASQRALIDLVKIDGTTINFNFTAERQRFGGFTTQFMDWYMDAVVPRASLRLIETDMGTEYEFGKGPIYEAHMEDVRNHGNALKNVPISLAIGQELAADPVSEKNPRGSGADELNRETSISAATRRRNSIDLGAAVGTEQLKKLKQLKKWRERAAARHTKRFFIRTWVRVRSVT